MGVPDKYPSINPNPPEEAANGPWPVNTPGRPVSRPYMSAMTDAWCSWAARTLCTRSATVLSPSNTLME